MVDITLIEYGFLFVGGIMAASLNAVAGGGTFFVFPILIFAGLPPTTANIINKTGIWTGAVGSMVGYWSEVKHNIKRLMVLGSIAAVGSIAGSILLLYTTNEFFAELTPWLLCAATLLFAFGRKGLGWLEKKLPKHPGTSFAAKAGGLIGQLAIGVYGGFFGAGKGIMMVALYELMGVRSVHTINGIKAAVAASINTVSVITFAIAGAIIWPVAIVIMTGALIGGYWGASVTKRLPQIWVRRFIIGYGTVVTTYFFLHVA